MFSIIKKNLYLHLFPMFIQFFPIKRQLTFHIFNKKNLKNIPHVTQNIKFSIALLLYVKIYKYRILTKTISAIGPVLSALPTPIL